MFRSSRHRFFLVLWWQAAFAFLGGWVGVESMPCVDLDRRPLALVEVDDGKSERDTPARGP